MAILEPVPMFLEACFSKNVDDAREILQRNPRAIYAPLNQETFEDNYGEWKVSGVIQLSALEALFESERHITQQKNAPALKKLLNLMLETNLKNMQTGMTGLQPTNSSDVTATKFMEQFERLARTKLLVYTVLTTFPSSQLSSVAKDQLLKSKAALQASDLRPSMFNRLLEKNQVDFSPTPRTLGDWAHWKFQKGVSADEILSTLLAVGAPADLTDLYYDLLSEKKTDVCGKLFTELSAVAKPTLNINDLLQSLIDYDHFEAIEWLIEKAPSLGLPRCDIRETRLLQPVVELGYGNPDVVQYFLTTARKFGSSLPELQACSEPLLNLLRRDKPKLAEIIQSAKEFPDLQYVTSRLDALSEDPMPTTTEPWNRRRRRGL